LLEEDADGRGLLGVDFEVALDLVEREAGAVDADVDLDLLGEGVTPLVDGALAGRDLDRALGLRVVGDAAQAHEERAHVLVRDLDGRLALADDRGVELDRQREVDALVHGRLLHRRVARERPVFELEVVALVVDDFELVRDRPRQERLQFDRRDGRLADFGFEEDRAHVLVGDAGQLERVAELAQLLGDEDELVVDAGDVERAVVDLQADGLAWRDVEGARVEPEQLVGRQLVVGLAEGGGRGGGVLDGDDLADHLADRALEVQLVEHFALLRDDVHVELHLLLRH